ncbi:MAG: hypothetical protein ACO1OB_07660 [Archangium sp.]
MKSKGVEAMRVRLFAVLALGLSACGGTSPSIMEFVEVVPAQPRIGDVTTVRFRLIDARGVPLAGAPVEFSLESANTGITLSPVTTSSLRGSGFAETQLVASSRVNSVIVVATSGDKTVRSPPITFAGTTANGRQLTFQCGPIAAIGSGGRHAIGAYDQTRHLIAGSQIDCSAHVADRNGDGIEGALVSFMTEAGAIGPSEISISNLVGDATVIHKTSLPLPVDVGPGTFTWAVEQGNTNTGEYLAPLWMHPFNWTVTPSSYTTTYTLQEPRRNDPIRRAADGSGIIELNPRDNLVSMIAITSGEEGFTDVNNNGVCDADEPYDDLTEPFVDSNDNGTWDPDERFIDVNGNRGWDGKNGKWDANTLIWKQERLLWTGIPANEDISPMNGNKRVFAPAGCIDATNCMVNGNVVRIDLKCPPGGFCSQAGNDQDNYRPYRMRAYISDPWFNSMARNSDSDNCEVPAEDETPVKVSGSTLTGFAFTYPSNQFIEFNIADKRDPETPPAEQIPRRSPPIGFRASILCQYTSSPTSGYVVKVQVGSIEGTIE